MTRGTKDLAATLVDLAEAENKSDAFVGTIASSDGAYVKQDGVTYAVLYSQRSPVVGNIGIFITTEQGQNFVLTGPKDIVHRNTWVKKRAENKLYMVWDEDYPAYVNVPDTKPSHTFASKYPSHWSYRTKIGLWDITTRKMEDPVDVYIGDMGQVVEDMYIKGFFPTTGDPLAFSFFNWFSGCDMRHKVMDILDIGDGKVMFLLAFTVEQFGRPLFPWFNWYPIGNEPDGWPSFSFLALYMGDTSNINIDTNSVDLVFTQSWVCFESDVTGADLMADTSLWVPAVFQDFYGGDEPESETLPTLTNAWVARNGHNIYDAKLTAKYNDKTTEVFVAAESLWRHRAGWVTLNCLDVWKATLPVGAPVSYRSWQEVFALASWKIRFKIVDDDFEEANEIFLLTIRIPGHGESVGYATIIDDDTIPVDTVIPAYDTASNSPDITVSNPTIQEDDVGQYVVFDVALNYGPSGGDLMSIGVNSYTATYEGIDFEHEVELSKNGGGTWEVPATYMTEHDPNRKVVTSDFTQMWSTIFTATNNMTMMGMNGPNYPRCPSLYTGSSMGFLQEAIDTYGNLMWVVGWCLDGASSKRIEYPTEPDSDDYLYNLLLNNGANGFAIDTSDRLRPVGLYSEEHEDSDKQYVYILMSNRTKLVIRQYTHDTTAGNLSAPIEGELVAKITEPVRYVGDSTFIAVDKFSQAVKGNSLVKLLVSFNKETNKVSLGKLVMQQGDMPYLLCGSPHNMDRVPADKLYNGPEFTRDMYKWAPVKGSKY